MTGWRLVRDRLPTKDNLKRRNIIGDQEEICCRCKDKAETADHLFLECTPMNRLWNKVLEWCGTTWAEPRGVIAHQHCFSHLFGRGKWRKRLGGLWACVIWDL